MKKLRQGLWALDEDGVRSYLVVGENATVLVDTGYGVQDFAAQIAQVTQAPVTLVITHADVDHVGGNAGFARRCMHPADLEEVRRLLPEDRGAYEPLQEGQVFDLGGCGLEVLECPGHTPGSIMLWNRQEGYLISGDSLGTEPVWLFGPRRDVKTYRESLLRIAEKTRGVQTVYPSHGETPLSDAAGLFADAAAAAEAALTGQPETEPYRIDYDPDHVQTVRLYAHGRAGLLVD